MQGVTLTVARLCAADTQRHLYDLRTAGLGILCRAGRAEVFEFPAGGVPHGHVTFHSLRARRARVERRECAACMWHSAACWRRAVVLSHMLCALCMQSCFSTPEARGGVGSEGPVVCGMLCAVAMLATEVARRALGLARKGAWRAALDAWANK